jgi:hypothetical protein
MLADRLLQQNALLGQTPVYTSFRLELACWDALLGKHYPLNVRSLPGFNKT